MTGTAAMRRGDDATTHARETALPVMLAAAGWTTMAPVAGDAFAAGLAAGLLAIALLHARPLGVRAATGNAGRRPDDLSPRGAPAPR